MKIVFTKHAESNFEKFKKYKITIPRKMVLMTIKSPDHVDGESDKPKIIASKTFSLRLVLRVVYKVEDGIITIITFYLAKKGRYYENN